MPDSIGAAFVEIHPDTDPFTPELARALEQAIGPAAERAGEQIESVFRQAATVADQALEQIGGAEAFDQVASAATTSGERVEEAFRGAASTADAALEGIGGAEAFNQTATAATATGEKVESAFREAARASDQALDTIGGAEVFTEIGAQAERSGERVEAAYREASVASDHALDRIGTSADRASGGVGRLVKAAAGLYVFQLVGRAAASAIDAFAAAAAGARITAQVIESTGGAANITADQVGALADRLSALVGVDDDVIRATANIELTFTNVRNAGEGLNAVFDRTVAVAFDMAAVMGTDASGAALQLGKALNDPIKGIAALGRAGVTFTADQKQLITSLVETGDLLGAQKIVLAEVEREFGGAAAAAASPLDALTVSLGNLKEAFGGGLAGVIGPAAESLSQVVASLAPAAEAIGGFLGQIAVSFGSLLGDAAKLLAPALAAIAPAIAELVGKVSDALGPAIAVVADLVTTVGPPIFAFFGSLVDAATPVIAVLADVASQILDALKPALDVLLPVLSSLATQLGGIVAEAFASVLEALAPLLPLFAQLVIAVVEGLAPVLPALGEAIGAVATALSGVLAEALVAIFDALQPVLPVIAELATTLGVLLVHVLDALLPVLIPLIEVIGDSLVQAIEALAPLLPPILEVFVSLVDVATRLLDSLAPILPLVVDLVLLAFAPLLVALVALAPILEALAPLINLVADGIGLLAKALALPGVLDAIGRSLRGVAVEAELVGTVTPETTAAFEAAALAATAHERALQADKKAMDLIVNRAPGVQAAMFSIGDGSQAVNDQLLLLAANFDDLNDADFSELASSLHRSVDDVKAPLQEAHDAIQSFVDGVVGGLPSVSDAFADVAQAAQINLPAIGEAFRNAITEAGNASPALLIQNLKDQAKAIQEFTANLAVLESEGFSALAQQLAEQGPAIGGALADAFVEGNPRLAAAAEEQVRIAQQAIVDATTVDPQDLIDRLEEQADAITGFTIRIAALHQQGLDALAAQLASQGPEIGGALAKAFLEGEPATAAAANAQVITTQQALDDSQQYFEDHGPEFGLTVQQTAELASQLYGENLDLETPTRAAAQAATTSIENESAAFALATEGMIDAGITGATDRINDPVSGAFGLGELFTAGLTRGIGGGIQDLINAAAAAAQAALDAVDFVWINFSPSHAAMAQGLNFGDGLALGIEGAASRVGKAAHGLGSMVLAGLGDLKTPSFGPSFAPSIGPWANQGQSPTASVLATGPGAGMHMDVGGVTINYPEPERASESVPRELKNLAFLMGGT